LKDRRLKESLGKQGLFVVEGQNDVIRLDTLGLPAVALCSNKATETQINKLEQLARTASQSRLVLTPDNDEEAEEESEESDEDALERDADETAPARITRAYRLDLIKTTEASSPSQEWAVLDVRGGVPFVQGE
jgi:DNA primase